MWTRVSLSFAPQRSGVIQHRFCHKTIVAVSATVTVLRSFLCDGITRAVLHTKPQHIPRVFSSVFSALFAVIKRTEWSRWSQDKCTTCAIRNVRHCSELECTRRRSLGEKSVREWGRKGSGVDKVLVKRLKHLLKKIEREQSDFFCFPLGVGGKNKH